jgi:murein DD-endopeptidase MepM/ murein hydrolase activator NlpD
MGMTEWRGGAGAVVACGAVMLLAAACGPRQTVHVVRAGETLSDIGVAYGVDYREIARANGITDPDWLRAGRRVVIPNGHERGRRVARAGMRRHGSAARSDLDVTGFAWPVRRGQVTSGFGPRAGSHHDGVDIAAPRGLPIVAAAAGEVLYAGRLRGYGNVVIVDHGGGYASVYAHNARNLVRAGAHVEHGEAIATVGQSGQATGPHLHFEIRKDNVARDPLRYLPPVTVRAARLATR